MRIAFGVIAIKTLMVCGESFFLSLEGHIIFKTIIKQNFTHEYHGSNINSKLCIILQVSFFLSVNFLRCSRIQCLM